MAALTLDQIKPADLPAPPQAAIQILRACAREDVNNAELSELAGSDPVLSAELLRIVNSAYFGFSREISTVPRAITILGTRALRNLVLCISVRDAVRRNAIPGFNVSTFWEDTLRRAVAARLLAGETGLDAEEAFTAGLLQDFGLLVMCFLQPGQARHWDMLRQVDPEQRLELEQKYFAVTHEQIIFMLGHSWSLPESLCQALGRHHHCATADVDQPLCWTLACADWMTAVYTARDAGACIRRFMALAAEHFGLDGETAEALLARMPKQVESAAQGLGLHIRKQADFDTVMREANARLAEENLSYQELTWKLERALEERDRLAAALNKELQIAREIQTGLLPPQAGEGGRIWGCNLSARILSGDFFDHFTLDDGCIYFNLGDVSGKGVTAALLMAKTSSLFRGLGKRIRDPAQLLATINEELCETNIRGMFVTLVGGLYNPASGEIVLANAGHPPALLMDPAGRAQRVEASGPPLGITPGARYESRRLQLDGGSLYLYSDGLMEIRQPDGEPLGLDGLEALLHAMRPYPPHERIEKLADQCTHDDQALADDVTLVLIEEPGA